MESTSKDLRLMKKKRKLKKKTTRISIKVKKTVSPSKDLIKKTIPLRQQVQDSKDIEWIDVENDYARNLKKVRSSSSKHNRKPFADIKSPKKSVVKKKLSFRTQSSEFAKKDDNNDPKNVNDFDNLTVNKPVDSQDEISNQTEIQQTRLEHIIPSSEESEDHDSDGAPEIPIKSYYIKNLLAVHIDEQFSPVQQTLAGTSQFVKSIQQQVSQIPVNERILPPKSKYIRKLQEQAVREVAQKHIDTAHKTVKEQIQPSKPIPRIPPAVQLLGTHRFFQPHKVPTLESIPTPKTGAADSPTKPVKMPKEEEIYENIDIIEKHRISKTNRDMVIEKGENGSGEGVSQKPTDNVQQTEKEKIQPPKLILTLPPVMQFLGYRSRFFQPQKVPATESIPASKTETPASRTESIKKPKEESNYENKSVIGKHHIPKINLDLVAEEDENVSEEEVRSPEDFKIPKVLDQQASWKASIPSPMEPIIEETESSPESGTSSSTPPKMIKRDFNQEPSTSGTKKFVEKPCMYYGFRRSGRNKSIGSYPTRRFQRTKPSDSQSTSGEDIDRGQIGLGATVRNISKKKKAQINPTNPGRQPLPTLPERLPLVPKSTSSDSNRNSTSSPSYPSSMSSREYQEMDFDDEPEEVLVQNRSQFNCKCWFLYLLLIIGLFGLLIGVYQRTLSTN
ncbi:uncharacterized protein LOC114330814 [Diabrotica virgifera virgifera]|uniref:Uncharacterized protein n=1 Tax=Diabrotica virgifera virgifera TaxID=50390 RepID=A0ABM5ILX7_DIAVI|nr:uncharacterized protein LOC114330814 [Diabrotica virgifera virgifera]